MTQPREVFVRYLRQRQELGERELMVSRELLEKLAAPSRDAAASRGAVAAPPPGSRASRPAVEASAEVRVRESAAAVASSAAPPALVTLGSLETIRRSAMACTACRLATTRTTVVFGEGDPGARLVVVGEAPGADEDRAGRPFVGRAGKLLDQLLLSVGFPRESVYICNVLKCRPPNNRNPLPDEVQCCSPFLKSQLETIAPRAVLAVGTFPAQTLLNTTEPISRLRGKVHTYEGTPLVPTYHPAALLRNPTWIRPVWEDLQRLRAVLDA